MILSDGPPAAVRRSGARRGRREAASPPSRVSAFLWLLVVFGVAGLAVFIWVIPKGYAMQREARGRDLGRTPGGGGGDGSKE